MTFFFSVFNYFILQSLENIKITELPEYAACTYILSKYEWRIFVRNTRIIHFLLSLKMDCFIFLDLLIEGKLNFKSCVDV